MFALVNGKPKFYIGKINGIGYTSEKEKENVIERLKEEDEDIEIINEEVEISKELREKAKKLGELQLTHSKSEFMEYLYGEKPLVHLELLELKEVIDILLREVDDE